MPQAEVNGVRLLVEEHGSGAPLVLVHGSWDDRQVWAFVEDDLAASFRVLSYDRRGHTGSEDSAKPGLRSNDEDDLAALIEARGLAPAHLVANSFGASITLGLLARRPELVRSVCAHEPPLFGLAAEDPAVALFVAGVDPVFTLIEEGDEESGAKRFLELVLGPEAWGLMSAEEQTAMVGNAGTFLEEQRDPDGGLVDLDALASVSCPVLLTRGSESPPMFGAVIEILAGVMEHAEVKTIPDAGHVPHLTHPARYVAMVTEFAHRAG
ncbi:MAG: alpha/beta fold hydrolase [Acidimicrobiia bacterium]